MKKNSISRFGNVDTDDLFTANPVDDWLDLKAREGSAPRTHQTLEDIIKENSNETALQQFLQKRDVDVLDASLKDLLEYKEYLQEKGHKDRDIRNKLVESSTFYNDLMDFGQTDSNPAGLVLKRAPIKPESPDRVNISLSRMGEFLKFISDPEMRSVTLMHSKYGVRAGIPVNVDLQCLHIDHERYYDLLDKLNVELREDVRDRPDSILFYGDFSEGDIVAGEARRNGSRRSHESVLPIDLEMKHSILEWLTMRPHTDGPPYPLYTSRSPKNGAYRRLRAGTSYYYIIGNAATDFGITDSEANREDVDLHYFRHFFRTQMKRHWGEHDGWIDDGLMQYIRGDEGAKPLEIYEHNHWGVHTREPYLENIYTFDLYD